MNITIKEMTTTDYETAQAFINTEDADADLISALQHKEKNLYGIFNDKQLTGLALLAIEETFLYLYINEAVRKKGIGSIALKQCEGRFSSHKKEQIMTTYNTSDVASKAFASKYGYLRKFSSTYMRYTGNLFDISKEIEDCIRTYSESEYDTAHELYAKAFHKMRLSVGDFPDSVVQQPTESMRKYWAETANERLVYQKDNKIVAYAHIEDNEISSVSVHPQFQGQGIGRNLVKYLCNQIQKEGYDEVYLYCVTGNKARTLYDSLGFQEICTIEYGLKKLKY